MKLSKKLKSFFRFSSAFPKSTFHLENFEKVDESHSLCLSEIIDCKVPAYVNV